MRLFALSVLSFVLLGCSPGSPADSPADFVDGNPYLPTVADQKVCYYGDMRKGHEPQCLCSNSMRQKDSDLWYCDWAPPPAREFTLKIDSSVCAAHPELSEYCK